MKVASRISSVLAVVGLLTAGDRPALAQVAQDPIDVVRDALNADRQTVVAEMLQLTPAEGEKFWPAYHHYRAEMMGVGDGIKKLVLEYAELYPDVPDDRAKAMFKDLLSLEKAQAAARSSFLRKASKILPPGRALRLAQVESRLDLATRAELAAGIPLVPVDGTIEGEESGGALHQDGIPGGVVVRTRRIVARVASIDAGQRRVTLVSPSGIRETVKVGPEAINFDQIQPGDQLEVVATEELMVRLAEPGDSTDDGAVVLVDLAAKGARPGGVVAAARRATGSIVAIDPSLRTVTLRFEDGATRSFPVRSDIDLGKRAVGDRVVFQVTEMVAIQVEKR